jgi:hypothetical protein
MARTEMRQLGTFMQVLYQSEVKRVMPDLHAEISELENGKPEKELKEQVDKLSKDLEGEVLGANVKENLSKILKNSELV